MSRRLMLFILIGFFGSIGITTVCNLIGMPQSSQFLISIVYGLILGTIY